MPQKKTMFLFYFKNKLGMCEPKSFLLWNKFISNIYELLKYL